MRYYKNNIIPGKCSIFFLIGAHYTISNVWSFLLCKIAIFLSVRSQMIHSLVGTLVTCDSLFPLHAGIINDVSNFSQDSW